MKPPRPPRFETRRAKELEAELIERARAWIPSWGMDDDKRDFGRALLKVAARFSSEVAERLDRAGEKVRLGLLDWLAVQGGAARPARLPVVFKLADSAREAKPAAAPTRLQVEAAGASVILETETDVLVLPRGLQVLVGVDGAADAFFLAPPGLSSLEPLEPLPTRWRLKSFASSGATKLQLDPEQGLAAGMLVELGGEQYRVTQVNKDIITLDPSLTGDHAAQSAVAKVAALVPFDGAARNRQEHALYIGHKELFNIEAAATIEITGAKRLAEVAWHYWGRRHQADEMGWQELALADAQAQAKSDGIVLAKPKGSMEMLELVKGSESRWIRASVGTVKPDQAPLQVDAFEIRINCMDGVPLSSSADPALTAPSAEAMANTTPLVLDNVFFPLGKEPRQFDAFYLSSKEAFSKKGAELVLDFEMADTTFTTLTAVREGAFAGTVLAGVAQDGALYLLNVDPLTGSISKFREREPLRPLPAEDKADSSPGIVLDRRPKGRLPVWHDATDPKGFLVAATAGDTVWVWREHSAGRNASDWLPFGAVPAPATSPTAPIADLVYLADTSMLFALRGGLLSMRKWPEGAQWSTVQTKDGANTVLLDAIVPVLVESAGSLLTSAAPSGGLIGVGGKKLYTVSAAGACAQLSPMDAAPDVRPVAVRRSNGALIIALAQTSLRDVVMFHSVNNETPIQLVESQAKVKGFEAVLSGGDLYFLASVQLNSGGYLASWTPHTTMSGKIELFRADIPASNGQPDGAPTGIARRALVPGTRADLLVAAFEFAGRLMLQADVGQGIVTPASTPTLLTNDVVTLDLDPADLTPRLIADAGTLHQGEVFYALDCPFEAGQNGALFAFRSSETSFLGDTDPAGTLELDAHDNRTVENALLLVGANVHRVAAIAGRLATIEPSPDAAETGVRYRVAVPLSGRLAPFMRLNATNNNWDAALLDRATLVFPGASPRNQTAQAFSAASGNRPLLVVMGEVWTAPPIPGAGATFVLDAAAGPWARWLGDTSTNPELSWEYWNGTGWWKLGVTSDETRNLKTSGALQFKVPRDLAPTDWSGRTNYWIRARLIGGDYGREAVSVATSPPDKDGVTHQTVERSTKDIHAPAVVKLGISYKICESVSPTYVLTNGSGSLRDQSDANRTAGAKVEAFVPLALLLGRLSDPATAAAAADGCKPDCHCPGAAAGPAGATGTTSILATAKSAAAAVDLSRAAGVATPLAPTLTMDRAVYLGFDAPLLGEPINVLLLVEERSHDEFAPMSVEALIADRFVPVIVNDATRALGESGVLSMAFPIEPTPRELFGQTLSWLRLTPAAGTSSGNWKPKLLGAYLNGVWASAAETLRHELVGSSQGEPNLTLYLARPPVLRDTLELRVNEPLGEEELDELKSERADQVLTTVGNLPGNWVLWKHVIDPGDEAPTARVYSLDEATGEIRFGDGRHGRIPPAGRDSIMAFTYRRSEPGAPDRLVVPGNAIAARTSLNLVSPIDGVEAVFAADQAAGGAPPEDVDRVLRFGVARLRHRERALTARDIEDLALESSPDVAQARCFPRNGFVQLVVVVRDANPMPSTTQLRELHRLLVAEAPPALSARQALRIGGPTLRRLRVDLRLRVASLDVAGAVGRHARQQIIALFDPATGGVDQAGWPLGENPTEADIALALADVPHLEGIAAVALCEMVDNDAERPWPASLKRTELPRLEEDGVRIEFETVEVVA